jgi:hypothetical protein
MTAIYLFEWISNYSDDNFTNFFEDFEWFRMSIGFESIYIIIWQNNMGNCDSETVSGELPQQNVAVRHKFNPFFEVNSQ